MFHQTYTAHKLPSACTAFTPSPPDGNGKGMMSAAAYGVWCMPYYALSVGMTQQFFIFVPGDLDL